MKIACCLASADAKKVFGGQIFAQELIKALMKRPDESQWLLLPSLQNQHLWSGIEKPGVRVKKVYQWEAGSSLNHLLRAAGRRLKWIPTAADVLEQEKPDLVHYLFAEMSEHDFYDGAPYAVTVHDCFHEAFPDADREDFNPELKRRVLGGASKVLTGTKEIRRQIERYFPETIGKIETVPYGVNAGMFYRRSEAEIKEVLDQYSLKQPYFFYPAALWEHKNHSLLLKALAAGGDGLKDYGVVFTGKTERGGVRASLLKEADSLGLAGRVHFLGSVPAAQMPALYSGAQALVVPSFYEGFGFPLVEAMACGCPVFCSDIEVFREVAGDAALYFDHHSAEDLSAKLCGVLRPGKETLERVKLGLIRSREFSWERCAAETIRVYLKVAGKGQRTKYAGCDKSNSRVLDEPVEELEKALSAAVRK